MTTDAIVLLREDHKKIKEVFREFERSKDASGAKRRRLVRQMIQLLVEHTHIENEVMYPRVRELLPDLEDDILESYEEHHVADTIIEELATMNPEDERFNAKAIVLIENVRHHIEEEESDWFPQVREGLGRNTLQEIGAEMKKARKTAPEPPGPGPLQKAVDAVFK
jgi:hemerythrin-like domain-containing protein